MPRFHGAAPVPQAANALVCAEAERGRRVPLVVDESHLLDPDQLERWYRALLTPCGFVSRNTRAPGWLRLRRYDVAQATPGGYAARIALRELGRRAEFLADQIDRLDELIVPLVTAHAPGALTVYGIGTAALLLVAAGDHPDRLRSEAAWAHLWPALPYQPHRESHPAPTQPWWRPLGQPCAVGDRDYPDELMG